MHPQLSSTSVFIRFSETMCREEAFIYLCMCYVLLFFFLNRPVAMVWRMTTLPVCRALRGNIPKGSMRSADDIKTVMPSTRPLLKWRERRRATLSVDPVYQGKKKDTSTTHLLPFNLIKYSVVVRFMFYNVRQKNLLFLITLIDISYCKDNCNTFKPIKSHI